MKTRQLGIDRYPAPPISPFEADDAARTAGWPRLIRTLGARLQADDLFERICRDVVEEFGFSRALIATVDERNHRLVARAGYDPGLPPRMYMALFRLFRVPLVPEPDGRFLVAAWSALHRQQAYVPDSRFDSFRPREATQRRFVIRALGTQEYVVTPVVYRGRAVAVLGVDKKGRGAITDGDRALLRDVAELLALRLGPLAQEEAAASSGGRARSAPGPLDDPNGLRSLLDGLEEGVLVVGPGRRVRHANRAAAALLELDPWDMVGSPLEEVLRPADPDAFWPLVESAGERGHSLKKRARILRASGAQTEVRVAVLPLAADPPARAIVIVPLGGGEEAGLDGELLRRSLHDLVPPLQSIVGFAELLDIGRAGALGPEQREFVSRIATGGEELIERVHRLLTGTALDAEDDAPRFERVPVEPVIERVIDRLGGKALRAHVRLVRDGAARLPPLLAIPAHLTAVFQNLLDNAIDAAGPGGTVRIRASTDVQRRMARFSVSQEVGDDPTGEQPETLDEDWSRSGVARKGRSHGLGLAIVRRVVEAHGGEVWAEGEPESDLSITFTIPLSGSEAVSATPA